MAGTGYDGSIRIDTKIEEKGFNSAIQKVGGKFKQLMTAIAPKVAAIGAVLAKVAAVGVGVVSVLIAAGIAAAVFGFKLINAMTRAISSENEVGQQVREISRLFADVKGAAFAAFAPLISAALPYIKIVVAWLTNVLNVTAQILAAMNGQSTYMKYVAGSAATAASATGKLAGETEKANKAAKGALASFDQLNVLAQESADNAGGGGGGGTMQFEETDIEEGAIETAGKIKKVWVYLIEDLKRRWASIGWAFSQVWEFIKNDFNTKIEIIKTLFSLGWEWIKNDFSTKVDEIKELWNLALEFIRDDFNEKIEMIRLAWDVFKLWVKERVIDPLLKFFSELWEKVKNKAAEAWEKIKEKWAIVKEWFQLNVIDPVSKFFTELWEKAKTKAGEAWERIKEIWTTAKDWFSATIIEPLKAKFSEGLENIKTKFVTIFEDVKSRVRNIVNAILGFINTMIRGVASGVNSVVNALNGISVTVPAWVPTYGGRKWGFNLPNVSAPQIPLLATGAVIPPNAPFLGVLGDQKSGRNLEAPESLIRQIIREEMGGGRGGDMTATVPVYLDGELIVSATRKFERRQGISLITGASA